MMDLSCTARILAHRTLALLSKITSMCVYVAGWVADTQVQSGSAIYDDDDGLGARTA